MIALGFLVTALSTSPLAAPFVDGDRVVWFGDSITAQHTFGRWVEEYMKLRHPELNVVFINAGIGGHSAWDGLARLDTDITEAKPSVVFVNFGMNDANYPPGTEHAAWERNMAMTFDRLATAGVKRAVWLDPSPLDAEGLRPTHRNAKRALRLEEMAAHAKKEGARRGITVVPFNARLTAALASWRAAKRPDKLLPDRVHPSPHAYAVLAAAVLRAIGADVTAPLVSGRYADGALTLGATNVPWTADSALTVDLKQAPAPLPMVVDKQEAEDLGDQDVVNLRRLLLRIEGLPADRSYRVLAGDVLVGVFAARDLARGVDLMATATPREFLTSPDARPSLAECEATSGNPWLNDHYCLFDLLYEKDQLRIAMRHEKTRHLPDFVPEKLAQYLAHQRAWVAAVDQEIHQRARGLRTRPHPVTLVPER